MLNLDLTDTKEGSPLVLPAGNYVVVLDEATIKETKAMTGEYINCKFRVLEGQYTDRFVFHMFNIKNENAKVVEIGLGQLKTFMRCAGATEFKLNSVEDLIGMIATAVVKVKVDDYSPEGKAVISYFKPREESAQTPKSQEALPF